MSYKKVFLSQKKAKNRSMAIWLYNILSNLVHLQEHKYTVHTASNLHQKSLYNFVTNFTNT